jgi:hypothetical protein
MVEVVNPPPLRPKPGARARVAGARRSVWGLLLATTALILAVAIIYVTEIAPRYDYLGYEYIPLTVVSGATGLLMSLVPLFAMPREINTPGDLATWILYVFGYIPACVIPALAFEATNPTVWQTPLVMLLGLGTMMATLKLPLPRWPLMSFSVGLPTYLLLLLVTVAIPIVYLIRSQGFQLDLSFESHYDRRFSARDVAARDPLVAYAGEWLGYFFVPLFAGLAARQRSLFFATCAVLSSLVLYAFNGTKGTAIMFVIGVLAGWGAHDRRRLSPVRMLWMMNIFFLVAILEPLWQDTILLTDLLVRRVMIVPGFLSGCYVGFFSEHPLMYLSDVTGFKMLIDNPYGVGTAFVIGEQHLKIPGLNANAGLWPNSFAQLHLAGVLLFSVLSALLLRYFDWVWASRRDILPFVAAASAALIWVEIPLLTSLTSAGVVFWPLLLLIRPDDK